MWYAKSKIYDEKECNFNKKAIIAPPVDTYC